MLRGRQGFCDLEEEDWASEQRPPRCTRVWNYLRSPYLPMLYFHSIFLFTVSSHVPIHWSNLKLSAVLVPFLWNTATDGPGLRLQMWIMSPVWCCATVTLCLSGFESGSSRLNNAGIFTPPCNLFQCWNWVTACSWLQQDQPWWKNAWLGCFWAASETWAHLLSGANF